MISSTSFVARSTIFVVYGGASLPATFDLNALSSSTGVRYFTNTGDNGGASVSGGVDINQDGYDDIIIGADAANDNLGAGSCCLWINFSGRCQSLCPQKWSD
jgi:hypothetical protein